MWDCKVPPNEVGEGQYHDKGGQLYDYVETSTVSTVEACIAYCNALPSSDEAPRLRGFEWVDSLSVCMCLYDDGSDDGGFLEPNAAGKPIPFSSSQSGSGRISGSQGSKTTPVTCFSIEPATAGLNVGTTTACTESNKCKLQDIPTWLFLIRNLSFASFVRQQRRGGLR